MFFHRNGFDEGDEIFGEVAVELNVDGTIEIEFSSDNGDDANLTAQRARLLQQPASGADSR